MGPVQPSSLASLAISPREQEIVDKNRKEALARYFKQIHKDWKNLDDEDAVFYPHAVNDPTQVKEHESPSTNETTQVEEVVLSSTNYTPEEKDLIDPSIDDGNNPNGFNTNTQVENPQPRISPDILTFVPLSVEQNMAMFQPMGQFSFPATPTPLPPSTPLNPIATSFIPQYTSHNHRYWGQLKRECPLEFNEEGRRKDQFLHFPSKDPNARNGEFVILVVDLLQKLYNPILPHLRSPNRIPPPAFPLTITSESTQNVKFVVTPTIFHQIINDVGDNWRPIFLRVWDLIAPKYGEKNWEVCEGCNPGFYGMGTEVGDGTMEEAKKFDWVGKGLIKREEWEAAWNRARMWEGVNLHD